MQELELRIISPEKQLFEGNIYMVRLPGTEGEFSILSGHAPLISSLKKGDIVYEVEKGSPETIHIQSGFVEIKQNIITVCID